MPKKRDVDRRGQQKGAQQHAEGAHGAKTHRAIIDQLRSGETEQEREQHVERTRKFGEHRLVEEREQHDPADENSEKNRLVDYLDENELPRDGHDVPGGH